MDMQVESGSWALTDKEKQTLRLIVRGHDAKSVARNLGLSVHTINERLRDARRKMAVSSSREAARLLLEAEDGTLSHTPDLLVDVKIGEDASRFDVDAAEAPISGVRRADRSPRIFIGVLLMTFALGLCALAVLPPASAPPSVAPTVLQTAPDAAVVDAARQWLVLVDQARWNDSYRDTGTAFQKLNTAEVWAATSEKVRVPLGAVISRTFVSQQDLPAPPAGYQVVKFRTQFANKPTAIETVSLEHEAGTWRVVGVTIE